MVSCEAANDSERVTECNVHWLPDGDWLLDSSVAATAAGDAVAGAAELDDADEGMKLTEVGKDEAENACLG